MSKKGSNKRSRSKADQKSPKKQKAVFDPNAHLHEMQQRSASYQKDVQLAQERSVVKLKKLSKMSRLMYTESLSKQIVEIQRRLKQPLLLSHKTRVIIPPDSYNNVLFELEMMRTTRDNTTTLTITRHTHTNEWTVSVTDTPLDAYHVYDLIEYTEPTTPVLDKWVLSYFKQGCIALIEYQANLMQQIGFPVPDDISDIE